MIRDNRAALLIRALGVSVGMQKQMDFQFVATKGSRPRSRVTIDVAGRKLRTTPVFDAYWMFAAERQRIFLDRVSNSARPTSDPILRAFKFTNTYRASDRVSQYLIRNVIYRDELPSDPTNLFFRILLFKIFNRIETWTELEAAFGSITWEDFSYRRYDNLLSKRMEGGERLYSAAYIMPSAGSAFGYPRKHQNHLRLIEKLISENYPARIASCNSMAEVYRLLLAAPSIGPFLAYQFATDLNYSPLTSFPETEFVVAGPGALDGVSKCFESTEGLLAEDVIRYMCDKQDEHFAEQGIAFPRLWERRLQLIDCQNIFCEISKYARVAFPEYAGSAGRVRIKQKYSPTANLPAPWYPPKWGLNAAIAGDVRQVGQSDLQGRPQRKGRRRPDRQIRA